jgi:hypothetical protein
VPAPSDLQGRTRIPPTIVSIHDISEEEGLAWLQARDLTTALAEVLDLESLDSIGPLMSQHVKVCLKGILVLGSKRRSSIRGLAVA